MLINQTYQCLPINANDDISFDLSHITGPPIQNNNTGAAAQVNLCEEVTQVTKKNTVTIYL